MQGMMAEVLGLVAVHGQLAGVKQVHAELEEGKEQGRGVTALVPTEMWGTAGFREEDVV